MRLIFLIICLFSHVSFALPVKSCVPADIKADGKNIILSAADEKKSVVYVLHNVDKASLWIDHPSARGAHAGWSSYLRQNRWSAVVLNRKNFVITCATIDPDKVTYRDCSKSIKVCTFPKLNYQSKRKGTYWLLEDKDWDGLISSLDKLGYKLEPAVSTPKRQP